MITKIGAFAAKTHLSELLDRVAAGERFTITRHGAPVAELTPAVAARRRDVRVVIARIRELGRGRKASAKSIRAMIEEGRRY